MLKNKNYVKAESWKKLYELNPESVPPVYWRNGMAENGQSQCNYSH